MRISVILGAAFGSGIAFGMLVPLPAALSQSAAQQCEDAGGDYDKEGSMNVCSFPVGNSTNTKDTGQQGSFNSSHGETFTNPGGNQPAGQQGGDTIGK